MVLFRPLALFNFLLLFVSCSSAAPQAALEFTHLSKALCSIELSVDLVNENQNIIPLFSNVTYGDTTIMSGVAVGNYTVELKNSETNETVAQCGSVSLLEHSRYGLFAYSYASDTECLWVFLNSTNPKEYGPDQAKVLITHVASSFEKLEIWTTSSDCYECLEWPSSLISLGETITLHFQTNFPTRISVRLTTGNETTPEYFALFNDPTTNLVIKYYDEYDYTVFSTHLYRGFGEHGVYLVTLSDSDLSCPTDRATRDNTNTQEITQIESTLRESDFALLAFVVGVIILAFIFAGYLAGSYLWKKRQVEEELLLIQDLEEKRGSRQTTQKKRVGSLDTFRGFCLVIMIFVNAGGGGYWFLEHSYWNGLTVADLVFPWFVWIMGVSTAISIRSLMRSQSKFEILYKIVRRSLILFGLGVFLNNGYELTTWRIPGVLQRFGVSYFFGAVTVLFIPEYHGFDGNRYYRSVEDIAPYIFQWIVPLTFILIWLLVTFLVDVPDCGRGYLGPGGIGNDGDYENCTGGASGYVDSIIFGDNHIYQEPTCQELYHTGAYDPEGFLGNFTSIFMTFTGIQAGRTLLMYKEHNERLKRWMIWGFVLGILSLALCGGSQNGGAIPINKNLWSLSFVLAMGGTGFVMLSFMYVLEDIWELWGGEPFRYAGMNSITLYCGSEVLAEYFPFAWAITGYVTHAKLLFMDVVCTACWCIIAYYMFICDFFIRI